MRCEEDKIWGRRAMLMQLITQATHISLSAKFAECSQANMRFHVEDHEFKVLVHKVLAKLMNLQFLLRLPISQWTHLAKWNPTYWKRRATFPKNWKYSKKSAGIIFAGLRPSHVKCVQNYSLKLVKGKVKNTSSKGFNTWKMDKN